VRERGVHLAEREDACAALQEQLHRRAQEIDGRHKEITDRLQDLQARLAEVEASKTALEQREQLLQEELEARRRELDAKAMEVEQSRAEVTGYEGRHQDLLTDVAVQRRTLAEERAQFHLDQQTAAARLADARNELDALRRDTLELVQQLADARSQLRDHLSEIHAYVRQCQDEMEQLRGKLQGDLDQLIGQEQNLRRSQDEHRLAVAAFKQQLIDWQGQITDLKRLLARDERHLEHKQARADERAKEIDQQSQKLAEHAEALQQQEVEVAERRDEIDRHLADMRQWYRHKLRELAGIPLMPDMVQRDTALAAQPTNDETGEDGIVPIGRSILSITAGADPSDQKLGELLRDAQLVDADTLTALLAEARRQRRSLRQVLLASGVVTLYQLALIETGNVQGLMLGPVRVLDRLRHTAHETAYRVFDPRRGAEAVLRHLSEAGMTDAIKPDEFRQRFAQAMLNDPRVANTLEVFDVGGRPAVLQEWLTGLSASDWPPLAAAPGVCYRLLTQAAQGLAVAHRAGLVHGHLSDAMMMLTAEGVLKIRGFGEPPWLIAGSQDDEPSVKGDLRTLGKIVSGWCTAPSVRKGAKTKPLPEAMVSILYRLAADGDTGYRDAQELIADLQNAANAIPANAEAWDRLLKYAREHAGAEVMLRQSA
jgi:predicted  nucleic acid-binding Zn-ribbon protein